MKNKDKYIMTHLDHEQIICMWTEIYKAIKNYKKLYLKI